MRHSKGKKKKKKKMFYYLEIINNKNIFLIGSINSNAHQPLPPL